MLMISSTIFFSNKGAFLNKNVLYFFVPNIASSHKNATLGKEGCRCVERGLGMRAGVAFAT